MAKFKTGFTAPAECLQGHLSQISWPYAFFETNFICKNLNGGYQMLKLMTNAITIHGTIVIYFDYLLVKLLWLLVLDWNKALRGSRGKVLERLWDLWEKRAKEKVSPLFCTVGHKLHSGVYFLKKKFFFAISICPILTCDILWLPQINPFLQFL